MTKKIRQEEKSWQQSTFAAGRGGFIFIIVGNHKYSLYHITSTFAAQKLAADHGMECLKMEIYLFSISSTSNRPWTAALALVSSSLQSYATVTNDTDTDNDRRSTNRSEPIANILAPDVAEVRPKVHPVMIVVEAGILEIRTARLRNLLIRTNHEVGRILRNVHLGSRMSLRPIAHPVATVAAVVLTCATNQTKSNITSLSSDPSSEPPLLSRRRASDATFISCIIFWLMNWSRADSCWSDMSN